jgi:hypothetical protein
MKGDRESNRLRPTRSIVGRAVTLKINADKNGTVNHRRVCRQKGSGNGSLVQSNGSVNQLVILLKHVMITDPIFGHSDLLTLVEYGSLKRINNKLN